MKYSYEAKNCSRDLIYVNRLRIFRDKKINIHKSAEIYDYYIKALLGIILM